MYRGLILTKKKAGWSQLKQLEVLEKDEVYEEVKGGVLIIALPCEDVRLLSPLNITEVAGGASKIIYIVLDEVVPVMELLVRGLNGKIVDQLGVEDVTENLIFELCERETSALLMTSPTVLPVVNFLEELHKIDVKTAVSLTHNQLVVQQYQNLLETAQKKCENQVEVAFEVVRLLQEIQLLMGRIQKDKVELTSMVEETQQKLQGVIEKQKKEKTSVVLTDIGTYIPQSVKSRKVYVKVSPNTEHIVTFFLYLQKYLQEVASERYSTKVLIVGPKLGMYTERYREMPQLNVDSLQYAKIDVSKLPYLYTNEPVTRVMDAFFSTETEVQIVVDMSFSTTPLLPPGRADIIYIEAQPFSVAKLRKKVAEKTRGIQLFSGIANKEATQQMPEVGSSLICFLPAFLEYTQVSPELRQSVYMSKVQEVLKKVYLQIQELRVGR